MDEQNIPIDINTSKLLEWLVSRRHISKDWQPAILKIREKINNAIQDMPAHEGIIKLLSGQHINYFHCLKIVDILKETEADSKNLFGRYNSQRMKDWQDIIGAYQKDNVYLAEVAQMLVRNVSYEIPSIKRQIAKLEATREESEKKIKDYMKSEQTALKDFNASCEQLGIDGAKSDLKSELLGLVKELPKINEATLVKVKLVQPAIELYLEFAQYLSGSSEHLLELLRYLIKNGNTITYEYNYGEKPISIEQVDCSSRRSSSNNSNEIDFGEGIDFSVPTDDSFEIVSHDDVSNAESGIIMEAEGEVGVARGEEALTLLDNPNTREQLINNLVELEAFLKLRLYEMSNDSDLLSMSQMQDAPIGLQMQTVESVSALSAAVNVALVQLTNPRVQHLFNLKHSGKYADLLEASLRQKLAVGERMRANRAALEGKIAELGEESRKLVPLVKVVGERSKELQRQIEQDISKKYKGRVVNVIGGVGSC